MGTQKNAAALQQLLLAARLSLKSAQPAKALELLDAALKVDGSNALAHFMAGSAHAALAHHAPAAAAFLHGASLTAGAEPGSNRHQLHLTCTDNLLLEAERLLPPCWVPALHDAPRLDTLQAGIRAVVAAAAGASSATAASSPPPSPRVLVIGGLGVEAVLAAKAGAASVALLCEANPLSAELAARLAADSCCAMTTATSAQQLSQLGRFDLVILADALGSSIDWDLLRRQAAGLAAAGALAPGASLLPHAVTICGQLVESRAVVALNEVDVPLLAADTGGLDLGPANSLLPRTARSVCLPAHPHSALTAPATLLTVPLASLLPPAAAGGEQAAALAQAAAQLAVTASGSADALAWWYEQRLVPAAGEGRPGSPEVTLSSNPPGASPQDTQLLPHVWQHVQYLDRRQLAAGQAVHVACSLAHAGLDSGAAGGAGAAAAVDAAAGALQGLALKSGGDVATAGTNLSERFEVSLAGEGSQGSQGSLLLPVSTEQAAIAAAVPRYHTAMLNDSARTAAYREGIAAALGQAQQQAGPRAAGNSADGSGDGRDPGRAPLVLEIGSGSGLLCLLACQAGARQVIGCERLPELQAAAAKLLAANGVADRVCILPKHSKELVVGQEAAGLAVDAAAGTAGAAQGSGAADLPRRANVLMHEIFGTDPFSEGVVPSLLHAKQHLLAPGAVLAPCSVRIIAAVAASCTQQRLLRPPAAVCGGAVATGALRQLAPRKVDCKAGNAGDLLLLTDPAAVLEVDFGAADLALADSSTVLIECLPRPLPMARWVGAQRAAAAGTAGDGDAPGAALAGDAAAAASQAAGSRVLQGASLFVVSWFEYEFPGGVVGSAAPHAQRTEHWQQMVQPLEGEAADAVLRALCGASSHAAHNASSDGEPSAAGATGELAAGDIQGLLLTVGYRVDRLWFELQGVAAMADGSDEEEAA